jgi:hypothetical protein
MSIFVLLALGPSRILLLGFIDGYQLRDKTHQYGHTDAHNFQTLYKICTKFYLIDIRRKKIMKFSGEGRRR